MKSLNPYPELNKIYTKTRNKLIIWLIVLALVFTALLAVSIFVENFFFDEGGIVFVISSFLLLFSVLVIYLAARSSASKSLSRFTPQELEQINGSIPQLQMQEGCGVTSNALIFGKNRLFIYPVRDILWIYKNVITTRLYGIPLSSQSSIVVCGKNGKQFSCKTKKNTDIIAFLQSQLVQYRRGIFYGYSPELNAMYRKDINRMIAISEERDSQP